MIPRVAPSLTGRLVLTAVGLVAVVGIVVTALTTLGLRTYLLDQLDADVRGTAERAMSDPRMSMMEGSSHGPFTDWTTEPGPQGQGVDTLAAYALDNQGIGAVLEPDGGYQSLTLAQLQQLFALPSDGAIHEIGVEGLGNYRVLTATDSSERVRLVSGLPTHEVSATVWSLFAWEIGLTLFGVLVAGLAGTALVRRQLAPLQRVAATADEVSRLSLGQGEVAVIGRVPDELTDPGTEVGQVGSALNTMLGHVEAALESRHRSEQHVRSFVADASHELRTPLSTIKGYAELARRTRDPELVLQALDKVETESARMTSLVEDLLLLARIDAGRPLAREEVDLTRIALDVVEDARVVADGHRWSLDLPDDPVVVVGDADQIYQVVSNLVGNVRRHTPAGTAATVALNIGDEIVELVVSDDGPGIDPEVLPSLFERFSRSDASRSRESGGVGLGLALVRAIAQAHGGDVTAESSPKGTRLRVTLPRRDLSAW
jgi:two-component system OmpR family sensor kinase